MLKTEKDEKIFLTINEAAAATGISRCAIRSWCKAGTIACLRFGSGKNAVYKIHFQKLLEMLDSMAETEAHNG